MRLIIVGQAIHKNLPPMKVFPSTVYVLDTWRSAGKLTYM